MIKHSKRPNYLIKKNKKHGDGKYNDIKKPTKIQESKKIQTIYKYKTSQLNHDIKCKQKQHTRRCKWCRKKKINQNAIDFGQIYIFVYFTITKTIK